MGCNNSKEPLPHSGHRSDAEIQATAKRSAISAAALRKLLKLPDDAKVPTVGLALSGGGWRSLTCSVAFLDGLAEAHLLDGVTYATGVSGGGWVIYEWMMSSADHNPFHKAGTPNPWFHGATFDSSNVNYEGLIRMRDSAHVETAALFNDGKFDGVKSTVFQHVDGKNLWIPAVLASSQLGKSPIERWSAFLKSDLLYWMPKDHDGAIPTTGHVADGTSPILSAAMVAAESSAKDKFNWMESSPFGLRQLNPRGIDAVSYANLSIKYDNGDAVAHPAVWHSMAASGAWFGIDDQDFIRDNVPSFDKLLRDVDIILDDKPIISGTLTTFTPSKEGAPAFTAARDAGVHENVAYPLLLKEQSERDVDIIIVLENSRGHTKPQSVAESVDWGDIPKDVYDLSACNTTLDESNHYSHVFKPKVAGYPIIIFCIGLGNESTLALVAAKEHVLDQTKTIRDRVAHHFAEVIKHEISAFTAVKPHA